MTGKEKKALFCIEGRSDDPGGGDGSMHGRFWLGKGELEECNLEGGGRKTILLLPTYWNIQAFLS